MSVTIIDFVSRRNHTTGEEFISLVLQGDLEIVTSESGTKYATNRRTTIPSTFDEILAGDYVGKTLPGTIEKVPCEPYKYTLPETGRVVTLDYTWEYQEPTTNHEHPTFNSNGNGVKV